MNAESDIPIKHTKMMKNLIKGLVGRKCYVAGGGEARKHQLR